VVGHSCRRVDDEFDLPLHKHLHGARRVTGVRSYDGCTSSVSPYTSMLACTCVRSCGCFMQGMRRRTHRLVGRVCGRADVHASAVRGAEASSPSDRKDHRGPTLAHLRPVVAVSASLPLPTFVAQSQGDSDGPGQGGPGAKGQGRGSSRDQVSVHREREFVVGYAKRTQRAV